MTIHTTDIQLFQILRQKPDEKEAEALVSFVDNKIKESNENNLKILATKQDISTSKEDMYTLKEDLAQVEGRLDTTIAETKVDIIKWVFGFFVTLALLIVGLYLRK